MYNLNGHDFLPASTAPGEQDAKKRARTLVVAIFDDLYINEDHSLNCPR